MKKIKLGFEEQILLNDLILSYETRAEIEKFILNDDDVLGMPTYQNILDFFEKENITDKDLRNMEFEFKEDFDISYYLGEEV